MAAPRGPSRLPCGAALYPRDVRRVGLPQPTNILVHRLDGMSWHTHTAHVTWEQTAGETVRTARSTRGDTGTRAGPNGETGGFTRQLDLRIGPLHRETAWLGVGLRAD